MGYRELHRMEIEEVVRRWQVNESQRAIARATGLARETVKKYLAAAGDLGLSATGPPPTERELVELRRLGVVATQPIMRVAPQAATLAAYRDQIATWIDDDHLLLTVAASSRNSGMRDRLYHSAGEANSSARGRASRRVSRRKPACWTRLT